jgi:hypothetical protein
MGKGLAPIKCAMVLPAQGQDNQHHVPSLDTARNMQKILTFHMTPVQEPHGVESNKRMQVSPYQCELDAALDVGG